MTTRNASSELDSWLQGWLAASKGHPCNPPHHLDAFAYATGYVDYRAFVNARQTPPQISAVLGSRVSVR